MTEQTTAQLIPMSTLLTVFGPDLEFSRELASLTSFGTGGRARYFISCSSADEIARAIAGAKRLDIPFFLIGGGSNLLVADSGYDGLIIKVEVHGMKVLPDSTIDCGAGEDLMALVNFSTENSLAGMEFAAGIWGTVGGAVYGNAGAFGGEIGQVLTEAIIVTHDGIIKVVPAEYCRFAYRDSYLKKTHEVVVSIKLRLKPGKREEIAQRVQDILAQREEKHPTRNTAGCFFKNILDPKEKYGKLPAGRLLEEIGAKQLQIGGARVFERHANIIVNTGNATSADIRRLADLMKQKVFDKFGIVLEEEVQQLGRF